MESTTLTLLSTEGPLRVSFAPTLTPAQYDELNGLIANTELRTRQQFRDLLAQLANEWGVAFTAEDVLR